MSKTCIDDLSTDAWGIPSHLLRVIFEYFKCSPTIDCFSDSNSKICEKYFSLYFEPTSSGTNFFAQELKSSEIYYICPPTHLNGFVLNRIVNTPGPVYIMIVPIWYASHWWPLIHNGQYFHPAIKAV